jgi:hypothetical protein
MITAIRRILGKRAPSLLRYAGITLIDVSLFWLTLRLASDGFVFIGLAFIIVAFFLTVVFFMKQPDYR